MTAYNITTLTRFETLTAPSATATLDTYTISNGATLTIDTDSFHSANRTVATGSLDTVSFTGNGGELQFDATGMRVVAYTGGGGTVPAFGATISQGGVSGLCAGVWASWQVAPTAVGAAMPATGFIKIRAKTGGNYAAGALTGITATSSGADVQGWIEVRGADTATITASRIGKVTAFGDWFYLANTSGVRGQIIQCPTTETIAGVFPAIWVETGVGTNVFDRWVNASNMAALAANPTDARGRIFWQLTTGIRLGSDGTNNVGALPVAGCRVRIPSIIQTCVTRTAGGSGARVLPNATLATRQEYITTNAADINLNSVSSNWYHNFIQAFRVRIRASAISDTLVLSEVASPLDIDNLTVAPTQAQVNIALNISYCFGGGVVTNVTAARFSLAVANNGICHVAYSKGISFSNCWLTTLTNRAIATGSIWHRTQNLSCTWTNCTYIGSRSAVITDDSCTDTNVTYADVFSGTTGTTLPVHIFELSAGAKNTTINGITLWGTNNQPYQGIVGASNCYTIKLRNIASAAAPATLGATNPTGLIFNSTGNNDGIKIQNVHYANTRTGAWAFVNTDNNVILENVSADYADASVTPSLNTIIKGCKLVSAATGQVSVYGNHWADFFTSATVGKIVISCNEPTALTAAQAVITSGTPQYNSGGSVALTVVGQQVTWEMPYFAKGHTALANLAPTLTGTTTGNLTYEFQYDKGTGYNGSWLVLNAANLNGAGAINPAIGVKLKVRATCATAAAGNLLTNISIPTVTTVADQNGNPYPLDTATVTVTSMATGSQVKATKISDGALIYNGAEIAGSSTFVTDFIGAIRIDVRKATGSPAYIPWVAEATTISGQTVSVKALQQLDE